MEINWFTFVVQIINFLILVWLLQRFLYEPITRAMNQRRLQIQATLDEAEEKRQKAEKQVASYQQKLQILEQESDKMLLQARQKAEEERQNLLQEVRREVDANKSRWYEEICNEREEFLKSLRRCISEEIHKILRQTLTHMANLQLEEQMVNVFIQRLQQVEQDKLTEIAQAVARSTQAIIISSPFPISAEKCQKIITVIEDYISPEIPVKFETAPDLICGISLTGGGQEIVWSLESYLRTLEENLTTMIEGN